MQGSSAPKRTQGVQINAMQQDLLQELVNIGLGRAAGALNQMTQAHVSLMAPSVRLVKVATLARLGRFYKNQELDVVRLGFSGSVSGVAGLLFDAESGSSLVRLMFAGRMGEEDLPALRTDTIREVGNVILIWTMGAIGNALKVHFEYSPLEYMSSLDGLLTSQDEGSSALLIKAAFGLEDRVVEGNIVMIFDGVHGQALLEAVDAMLAGQSTS